MYNHTPSKPLPTLKEIDGRIWVYYGIKLGACIEKEGTQWRWTSLTGNTKGSLRDFYCLGDAIKATEEFWPYHNEECISQ